MPAPCAYLVTGIPGAGKTTISHLLAKRFERSAHVEADRLQELIVSGGVWPDGRPPEEAERQLELRARNAASLAGGFFDAGFVPVIDDVIVGPRRLALYTGALRARPLHLVVLAPPLEVCLERDAARLGKHVGARWAHLDGHMRRELAGYGTWLDSSGLDPSQTVDRLLAATSCGRGCT